MRSAFSPSKNQLETVMKIIQIRQSDWLWALYCLSFTLEGKSVQEPKNICPYFWTAMKGLRLWFMKVPHLGTLWLYMGAILGMACTTGILSRQFPDSDLLFSVFLIYFIVCHLGCIAMVWITMSRATIAIKKRPKLQKIMERIMLAFFAIAVLCLLANEYSKGTLWSSLARHLKLWFTVFITVALIVVPIMLYLLKSKGETAFNSLNTLAAYVKAVWGQYCTPVIPPPEFKKAEK
jgi:hypothetical protein